MIISFRHKGLRLFHETGNIRGIQPAHAQRLPRQLQFLDRAVVAADLCIPGWQLHPLKGERAGSWSVSVSGNWRLVFRFTGCDVELVDYLDYHGSGVPIMPMHNPPHPGETLREDVLPALGLTVKAFAAHLGFSREALSRVLHARAAVSPDLAVRLEMAGISTARLWLTIQVDYDIWQARQRQQPVITRLFQAA